MKTIKLLTIILVLLLAGCTRTMGEGNHTMGGGQGGGMGGGDNMMARHHATIPDEYAGLTNPVAADEASLARGEALYAANCASCHGDGGMGDGVAAEGLDPAPVAVAHTSQMMGDDYLFWRISEGGTMAPFNSTMLAWKGSLDEEARWDLINYMRALGSGEVMPRQGMGGARFDPEMERRQRAEMLGQAVEQGLMTQEEADLFTLVHNAMDEAMAAEGNQGATGNMDQRRMGIVSNLVIQGTISQEDADAFNDIHDRLVQAELMQ